MRYPTLAELIELHRRIIAQSGGAKHKTLQHG